MKDQGKCVIKCDIDNLICNDSNMSKNIEAILQFSTITILQYHFKHPNHHIPAKKARFMSLKYIKQANIYLI